MITSVRLPKQKPSIRFLSRAYTEFMVINKLLINTTKSRIVVGLWQNTHSFYMGHIMTGERWVVPTLFNYIRCLPLWDKKMRRYVTYCTRIQAYNHFSLQLILLPQNCKEIYNKFSRFYGKLMRHCKNVTFSASHASVAGSI